MFAPPHKTILNGMMSRRLLQFLNFVNFQMRLLASVKGSVTVRFKPNLETLPVSYYGDNSVLADYSS
jgi:hypothetical protein